MFDDRIILFSDKSCAYPSTGNAELDWHRWHSNAVTKSMDQLYGAERWLKDATQRIYLDPGCTRPLPIFPPSGAARFYRIAVAMGAGPACRSFHGGSGSLIFAPGASKRARLRPFWVDGADARGLVHVLDDATLETILSQLDTIADFVEYLDWKEQLVREEALGVSAGEENLLALFLTVRFTDRELPPRGSPDVQYVVADNQWASLLGEGWFRALQDSYRISYLWDRIIDHLASAVLNETMLAVGGPSAPADHERRLRALARLSRVTRISLAESVYELIAKVGPGEVLTRVALPAGRPDTGIVLLIGRPDDHQIADYEAYRGERQAMLRVYCMCFKSMHPALRHVVGLAVDAWLLVDDHEHRPRSEDVMYIGSEDWTPSDAEEARAMRAEMGILSGRPRESFTRAFLPVHEALERARGGSPASHYRKVGRNEPCPCRSGKKFKKCHGR